MALVDMTKNGKGKGSKGNNEGKPLSYGRIKDLSKINSFSFHKFEHYPSYY